MKKANILITILLGLAISLVVGKAVLQNALSTSGIFVSKTEKEINFYKTQNAILSEQLLTSSSLTNIAEVAKKSGFVNDKTLIVIKSSQPMAVRP